MPTSTPAKSGSASSITQPRSSKTRRFGVDDAADLRLERDSAKPTPPRDADSLEAATERRTEARAVFLDRQAGSRGSGPAIALRKSATSATERAIGPDTESGDQDPDSLGTRPGDGRKPTTLQNAAGFRSEPPVSLPSAIGTMPHASATAAPPLLPPQVLSRSYGLRVAPKTALNVCEPAPNSGVLVLPRVIAPACANTRHDQRIRCRHRVAIER